MKMQDEHDANCVSPARMLRARRRVVIPLFTILDLYLLREMVAPFSFWVLIWVTILTGHFLYWQITYFERIPGDLLLRFALYHVPYAATFAIPIAMIFTTGTVINRFGREGEAMACWANGLRSRRILMPFLFASLLVSGFDFYLTETLVPKANQRQQEMVRRFLIAKPEPMIQEDKFLKLSGNYYFHVRRVHVDTQELEDVMLYEKNPTGSNFPRVLLARRAQHLDHVWHLYDGVIHHYNDQGRQIFEVPFRHQILNLKEPIEHFWSEQRTPEQMAARELRQQIELFSKAGMDTHTLEIDYYFKLALPAACFIMTLWAAPLTLRLSRSGNYTGLLIAFLAVFFYQGIMTWAKFIGTHYPELCPPFVAAWMQNLIFAFLGLLLWLRER